MTLTYLDIYNEVTGQAWSMFDSEVEDKDEFESSVTSSIQKALTELWCSYPFPFRIKDYAIKTKIDVNSYALPTGNILKKTVAGEETYSVKIGKEFLDYESNYETLDDETGKPRSFYVKNDKLYLYPTPDDVYKVDIEYLALQVGFNEDGEKIYQLIEDTDYLDIPEKYEVIFKNALITLAMYYAIASREDENSSSYKEQYENAYKILVEYAKGINTVKRITW